MLDRLSVQQKLSLLLTLPLAALVLVGVPFVVSRTDDAIAARATVTAARDARQVGALLEDLQQERLIALATLASPDIERTAFVALTAATSDRAAEAGRSLGGLDEIRQQVLRRAISPAQVQDAYHTRVRELIDGLRLTRQPRVDPIGARQMSSLDALLRANEEASRMGAALVVAITDGRGGANLVAEARALHRDESGRFRQQASPSQVALLDLVQQGANSRRIEGLANDASGGSGLRTPVPEVVGAAQTTSALGRALQERIMHDIAVRAEGRAAGAEVAAILSIALALLLILVVVYLGVLVSRSVAVPLRRLTNAAGVVADLAGDELFRVADRDAEDSSPPKLAAVEVRTGDEIGELAVAFNRVQATAALLMEQQAVNRHNVSIMFANIALRTRALVARQLAFIDEFERNEQDERMLAKLYRLDHLTTRLRRSADSLLVVSGIRKEEQLSADAPLLEVVRSAVAEIEGYQAVHVAAVPHVTVLPQLVPDLRLLLAELLENATAFSPPGAPVEVTARLTGDCVITVVDHGIGLSPERLEEENRRLVERERLEIAPTSVLGLFVVGRLARRHGLTVRLTHSPGQGVTAEVRIPPTLLTSARRQARPMPPEPIRVGYSDFHWFDAAHLEMLAGNGARAELTGPATPVAPSPAPPITASPAVSATAGASPAESASPPVPSPPSSPEAAVTNRGLRRRDPGEHLPSFGLEPQSRTDWPVARDPGAERAELEEFTRGVERATGQAPPAAAPSSQAAPYASAPVARAQVPQALPPAARAQVPQAPPPAAASASAQPGGAGPVRSRSGLTRRVPGSHLDHTLRSDDAPRREQASTPRKPARDPDAERAALDSFTAGLARAQQASTDAP
jgi:signal transduction histidine kinase